MKLFKNRISSGCWFFQITINKETGCWHPHIHCLVNGLFISQKKLSKAWSKATGGSYIVDIRAVKDVSKACKYVSRYASKPCYIASLSDVDAYELHESLVNRRLFGTWGKKNEKLLFSRPKLESEPFEILGSFTTICSLARFDDNAACIFSAWISGSSLTSNVNVSHIEKNFFNSG